MAKRFEYGEGKSYQDVLSGSRKDRRAIPMGDASGRESPAYAFCEYDARGLDPFLDMARAHVRGEAGAPSAMPNAMDHRHAVTVYFSEALLARLAEGEEGMRKPVDVAMRFGYRGFSKGEKNGIFRQRKGDGGLRDATARLVESRKDEVIERLGIPESEIPGLEGVKIVWHNPEGERVVGVYHSRTRQMLFLDTAEY